MTRWSACEKSFRLAGDAVHVTKIGDRLILEPLDDSGPDAWALIDAIGDKPFAAGARTTRDARRTANIRPMIHLDAAEGR